MQRIFSGLLLFGVLLSLPLFAQDRAAINGTIMDPTGAIVPGASVELDSTATGLHRATVSNLGGLYEFTPLPVGSYTLKISKDGFKPTTINNVDVQYAATRTVDAKLEIGAVSESVVVEATTEAVNRTNAEVSGVIESAQIKEIPVSGRNWASLMLLAPGAINYGDGAQRSIRFSGHSLDDSNFTMDGVDASGVQEQTQKADARLNIALDAIQEFRVTTSNYTAESGAAGGAQINVVSKSGSNGLHGSLFYALRKDALDSKSPFDDPTTGLPPFSLHQFGVSVGGPIKKDRAFFYANYEGLRQDLGETLDDAFVPSAAFRTQVLAKSPVLRPILDAYPLGIATSDPGVNLVTGGVASDRKREDAGMLRFDYRFDDNNSVYARYNVDDSYADTPTDSLGGRNVLPLRPTNVVLQYQRTLSPTLINEAKIGLNRASYHNFGYGTSPIAVTIPGYASVSDTSLDTEVGTTFSYIDDVTKILGRHTFKFGADIRRIRLNNSGNTLTTSSITFASTDNFINNKPDSASYNQGEGVVGNRRTFYQGYAQDEFRLNPELTLNLGLRYEFYSVTHEIHDRSAVVDIIGCGGFCPKGTPYYDPNYKDFGPRLGLAWAPAALHGKTSIRGGFGLYYGGNQNDDFSDPAESAVPRYTVTSSNLSYPIEPFLVPGTNQAPKAIDRHRKDLYYENWDLVIEQQLPSDWLLQVGYTGGEGHHLFSKYTVNLINPATGTRQLAAFSSFGLKANDGNNNFNALQVSLNRRFTRGLLFQTNYMWSHGITDGSNGSGDSAAIQNMACRACDRSNSSIDVRHNLTTNFIYELPFGHGRQFLTTGPVSQILGGWQLSGIITARSGLPVNITMTRAKTDLPDQNTSNQRPDLVPGVSIYAVDKNTSQWFNAAAFALPAKGVWGNAGRYIPSGPGMYEFDSTLQKRFPITERITLNFRASAYNLFNHAILKTPSGSIGALTGNPPSVSKSFGTITNIINTGATGTGAKRRIEFMFRVEF